MTANWGGSRHSPYASPNKENSWIFIPVIIILWSALLFAQQKRFYPWLAGKGIKGTVAGRFPPPEGFVRIPAALGTFGNWLRYLPLKEGNPPVHLFNGREKFSQSNHAAVLDLDVGHKDLQQCADTIIRLRAEFLYSQQRFNEITFHFTSGDEASFNLWSKGNRPFVVGNWVKWIKKAHASNSYATFRNYLETVFRYAGTASLEKELVSVKKGMENIQIGDVFIHGGFPGHAVLVVDVARNPESGETVFLLVQGYMPAQEAHLLVNPNNRKLSPWFACTRGSLKTPDWTFSPNELRRFQR